MVGNSESNIKADLANGNQPGPSIWWLIFLALVLAMVILGLINHFWFKKNKKVTIQDLTPTSWFQKNSPAPELKSKAVKFVNQSQTYSFAKDVEMNVYQTAINSAWQELVEKGFATRDKKQPQLVTINYPPDPNSTQLVQKVVDTSQPVVIKLVDDKTLDESRKFKVKIAVNSNRQLVLTISQEPQLNDPGLVGALSMAFHTMAVGGRDYSGPVPVITSLQKVLQAKKAVIISQNE